MACHWGPVLWPLLTDPSGSLQAPTACCDGQFLLAGALEWPPGFRGHHQPPNQTRALPVHTPLTTLTMMMWLWRTLPHTFFTNLIRRGNMLEIDEAARTKKVAKSFISISRNHSETTGRVSWMQWSVHYTWKKCESVSSGTAQTGHWQKQTLLVWFHWDICPEWVDEIH